MEEAQAVEAPVETPTQAEAPATSETSGDTLETPAPKSENRYQKLASENKRMRDELSQLQSQSKTLDGAQKLDAWLRQDPKNLRYVMDLMEGKSPQSVPDKDPYEAFAPEVAEKFRRMDAIERRLAQEDQQRQEAETRSVEENKAHLESVYITRLKTDGFINKDGTFDEHEVDLLSDAVLSRATRLAKDPYKITEREFTSAYEQIIKATKSLEKRGLKNTVKPTPPLSGSKSGSVPAGRARMTEEERIAAIAKELE